MTTALALVEGRGHHAPLDALLQTCPNGSLRQYVDRELPESARYAVGESIGATMGAAAQVGPQAVAQIQGPAFDAFVSSMHVTAVAASCVAGLGTLLALRFLPSLRPAVVPGQVGPEGAAKPVGTR
jgi:MFS transporter, DHA2 family, multidrug resistance protein